MSADQTSSSATIVNDDIDLSTWYRPHLDRRELKKLSKAPSWRGPVHIAAYFGLLTALGVFVVATWGTWWLTIPLLLVYGNVWSLGSIALEHELLHGTFIRSRRVSAILAHVCGYMCGLEATRYRWTHYVHHSNTLATTPPFDVESVSLKPIDLVAFYLNLVPFGGLVLPRRAFWYWHREVARNATGRLTAPVRYGVPEAAHPRIVRAARIHVAVWLLIVASSVVLWSPLPALLLVFPTWYGSTLFILCGFSQHAGLPIDVRDHRLNTRSFVTNPVLRFLYFGMEYHLEHHLFPQVPSHNLPKLHAQLGDQLPEPRPGLIRAWRHEILPSLHARARDASYFFEVPLPPTPARR